MIGQRFAKLTVVSSAHPILRPSGKRRTAVIARCDCGAEKRFDLSNLRNGNSKSCGCEKLRGLAQRNAERAVPQAWMIHGDVASLEIDGVAVLVDVADVPLVGQYRWHLNNGYAVARGGRLAMHRLILGLAKGDPREGDHVHHVTTDNRRSELRIASSGQNKWNARQQRHGKSPFKGVSYDQERKKYRAQIKLGGHRKMIGRFATERDAAAAYNAAASQAFGEFAYLNVI